MATRVTHSPLGVEVREEQQRIVLDALLAAAGEPVAYSRLRDAGVEFPAAVITELELAGLTVSRGPRTAAHSRDPVVRLREPVRIAVAEQPPPAGLLLDPPVRRSHRGGVLLATVASSIACAVIGLAAIGSLGSRGHVAPRRKPPASAPVASVPRPSPRTPPSRHQAAPAASRKPRLSARARPPATGLSAAALQLSGHELLAAGRYAQARTVLGQAMRATGMDVAGCAQPVGESCVVYAYALYDFGRALLLEGRPHEAVAVLEARLQIANQEPVVAAELALARAAAARALHT